ncbi:SGNH/GDSL hydrolase family protein [Spirillospora sp. NPDC048911]|uniref:SGNH/GDSL hydrolase family protein n=1 Tax=Spirillospora sp. NPDC048911 TaxID=3364527 RepID=UPI0037249D88
MAFLSGSVACGDNAVAAEINYVALGDSYASGTGAGAYDPSGGKCERSEHAYPRLWAAQRAVTSFGFMACSGARTTGVLADQLGALSPTTTLVTVTAGGNDAGFAKVMETCVLRSADDCTKAVSDAEEYMATTLPDRLDTLYRAIREKAPSARVVVLGYPRLYKIVNNCAGLSKGRRTALNRGADSLDITVAAAASRAGFVFSDVRDEFAGHELCSGHGWLHSVEIPLDDSYHPTARGHRLGYLPALNSADPRSQR